MRAANRLVILGAGMLFGAGLAVSNLARQEVVLDFVQLEDLGLAVMMMTALAVTIPIYQLAPRLRPRPALGPKYDRFPRRIKSTHIIGGVLFGLGWGLAGVCPGSAIASAGLGNWPIVFALVGMLAGAYVQGVAASRPAAVAPSA